jgi:hypothetical protein
MKESGNSVISLQRSWRFVVIVDDMVERYSNENQGYLKKCVGPGILRGNLDPVAFHPYRANAAMEEIYRRPDSRQVQWAYPLLRKIGTLARAMGYLVCEIALGGTQF